MSNQRTPKSILPKVHSLPFLALLLACADSATAQEFFLQGADGARGLEGSAGSVGDPELVCDGTSCTLEQDLVVRGSGTFDTLEAVEASITIAEADGQTVNMSVWMPECPRGYRRDRTCPSCDRVILCVNGLDEMVKVGDFWVDRYEASVWQNANCTGTQYGIFEYDWDGADGFPHHGSFSTPLYACSVRDEIPSRWLTWFHAQSACAASGKRLLTNAEWQAAVAGTHDPPVDRQVSRGGGSSR